jgi:hypothetical protein
MNAQAKPKRRKAQKHVTLPSAMPTDWDMGAAGQANRIGLIREDATELDPKTGKPMPNPNGVKRMRRVDMLEVWHKQGTISTAGFNAAEKLRDVFEATMQAPGWPDNDRVQSSPKPDHAVTIQIDRLSRFHAVNKLVPVLDRPIINRCVLERGTPSSTVIDGERPYRGARYQDGLTHLKDALDRLARAMG